MSDVSREERPAEAVPPPRFEELAALGHNAWWRYLLALILFVVLTVVGMNLFAISFATVLAADIGLPRVSVYSLLMDPDRWSVISEAHALAVLIGLLIMFIPPLLAILVTVRLVHWRPWRTLLTGRPRFGWAAVLSSFAITWGLLAIVVLAGFVVVPEDYLITFDAGQFLLFLPFVLALVPLQVLAEEVLFRGYLLQALHRLTANPAALVLVPAALFVVPHLWNPEVSLGGLWVVTDYIVIALYLTWLALKGNGLEYAFGFHLGINLFLFLILGSPAAPVVTPTILVNQAPDFATGAVATVLVCIAHYWLLFGRAGAPAGRYPVVMRAGR